MSARAVYYVRGHLVGLLVLASMAWLCFAQFVLKSDTAFGKGLVFLVAGMIAATLFERARMRKGIALGRLAQYGKVLDYCGFPKPGSSMIESLKVRGKVEPVKIKALYLQTCSYANEYLKKYKAFLASCGIDASVCVQIVGTGTAEEKAGLSVLFPCVELSDSRDRLTEHFNIIEMTDGQFFVWYEPYHDIEHSSYNPRDGAFLVKVEDCAAVRAAFAHFREPIAA